MSFVSLYKSQLKSADRAVKSARTARDNKKKAVRALETEIDKLEQRMRKANSESQAKNYDRQIESKSGRLTSERTALGRTEDALSKAEENQGKAQQKLRDEEEKDRNAAERKEQQEKDKAERAARLQRQRDQLQAQRIESERATREAQRDDRIGELEQRLIEAERRSAPPEITVLFLASCPEDQPALRLDKETREIQKRMRATEFRDSIFIEWRLARQIPDLIGDLNEVQPDILHFSGHGNDAELAFEDESGKATSLTNEQVKRLLDAAPKPIRLFIFNSCHSSAQAELAIEHVDIAIGMETTIGDAQAQTFAGQLYNSLGFGVSVAKAFGQALFQIEAEHGGGHEIPKLFAADGVDPETVVLVNPDAGTAD